MTFLRVLGQLAAAGIIATIRETMRDGYHRRAASGTTQERSSR